MKVSKPCKKLGYCPYGILVEQSSLPKRKSKRTCDTFGHTCPVFKNAENLTG